MQLQSKTNLYAQTRVIAQLCFAWLGYFNSEAFELTARVQKHIRTRYWSNFGIEPQTTENNHS